MNERELVFWTRARNLFDDAAACKGNKKKKQEISMLLGYWGY